MSADHGHGGGGHAPKASSGGGSDTSLGKGALGASATALMAFPALIAAWLGRGK